MRVSTAMTPTGYPPSLARPAMTVVAHLARASCHESASKRPVRRTPSRSVGAARGGERGWRRRGGGCGLNHSPITQVWGEEVGETMMLRVP